MMTLLSMGGSPVGPYQKLLTCVSVYAPAIGWRVMSVVIPMLEAAAWSAAWRSDIRSAMLAALKNCVAGVSRASNCSKSGRNAGRFGTQIRLEARLPDIQRWI